MNRLLYIIVLCLATLGGKAQNDSIAIGFSSMEQDARRSDCERTPSDGKS